MVMQRKPSIIRRLLYGPPVEGPDARPAFRVMAYVQCVVLLAGGLLGTRRYLDGSGIFWGIVALVGFTYGFVFGHLALTGRWVAGRNHRL
jgi:hypothetical protein